MTYGYSYKTPDGTRHEDTFAAKSKEEVFSSLRAKGVKPIKVWEIHSRFYVSRRTRVIIVLALALALSLAYALRARREVQAVKSGVEQNTAPRHQIYGDPAIWENIERDNFATVFAHEGDRLLAAYAIPGRPFRGFKGMAQGGLVKLLEACKDEDIAIAATDTAEAAELKRIVQGMKEELRWYLADGVGTIPRYLMRLNERQDEEQRIYERTRQELENCTDETLREERNAALRAMGLRTIPRPRKEAE